MSKRLDYFIDRLLVCGSISLVVGSMTGLATDYSHYVGFFLFVVLMVHAASVAPEDENEFRLHLSQASLLAQNSPQAESDFGSSDGGAD